MDRALPHLCSLALASQRIVESRKMGEPHCESSGAGAANGNVRMRLRYSRFYGVSEKPGICGWGVGELRSAGFCNIAVMRSHGLGSELKAMANASATGQGFVALGAVANFGVQDFANIAEMRSHGLGSEMKAMANASARGQGFVALGAVANFGVQVFANIAVMRSHVLGSEMKAMANASATGQGFVALGAVANFGVQDFANIAVMKSLVLSMRALRCMQWLMHQRQARVLWPGERGRI